MPKSDMFLCYLLCCCCWLACVKSTFIITQADIRNQTIALFADLPETQFVLELDGYYTRETGDGTNLSESYDFSIPIGNGGASQSYRLTYADAIDYDVFEVGHIAAKTDTLTAESCRLASPNWYRQVYKQQMAPLDVPLDDVLPPVSSEFQPPPLRSTWEPYWTAGAGYTQPAIVEMERVCNVTYQQLRLVERGFDSAVISNPAHPLSLNRSCSVFFQHVFRRPAGTTGYACMQQLQSVENGAAWFVDPTSVQTLCTLVHGNLQESYQLYNCGAVYDQAVAKFFASGGRNDAFKKYRDVWDTCSPIYELPPNLDLATCFDLIDEASSSFWHSDLEGRGYRGIWRLTGDEPRQQLCKNRYLNAPVIDYRAFNWSAAARGCYSGRVGDLEQIQQCYDSRRAAEHRWLALNGIDDTRYEADLASNGVYSEICGRRPGFGWVWSWNDRIYKCAQWSTNTDVRIAVAAAGNATGGSSNISLNGPSPGVYFNNYELYCATHARMSTAMAATSDSWSMLAGNTIEQLRADMHYIHDKYQQVCMINDDAAKECLSFEHINRALGGTERWPTPPWCNRFTWFEGMSSGGQPAATCAVTDTDCINARTQALTAYQNTMMQRMALAPGSTLNSLRAMLAAAQAAIDQLREQIRLLGEQDAATTRELAKLEQWSADTLDQLQQLRTLQESEARRLEQLHNESVIEQENTLKRLAYLRQIYDNTFESTNRKLEIVRDVVAAMTLSDQNRDQMIPAMQSMQASNAQLLTSVVEILRSIDEPIEESRRLTREFRDRLAAALLMGRALFTEHMGHDRHGYVPEPDLTEQQRTLTERLYVRRSDGRLVHDQYVLSCHANWVQQAMSELALNVDQLLTRLREHQCSNLQLYNDEAAATTACACWWTLVTSTCQGRQAAPGVHWGLQPINQSALAELYDIGPPTPASNQTWLSLPDASGQEFNNLTTLAPPLFNLSRLSAAFCTPQSTINTSTARTFLSLDELLAVVEQTCLDAVPASIMWTIDTFRAGLVQTTLWPPIRDPVIAMMKSGVGIEARLRQLPSWTEPGHMRFQQSTQCATSTTIAHALLHRSPAYVMYDGWIQALRLAHTAYGPDWALFKYGTMPSNMTTYQIPYRTAADGANTLNCNVGMAIMHTTTDAMLPVYRMTRAGARQTPLTLTGPNVVTVISSTQTGSTGSSLAMELEPRITWVGLPECTYEHNSSSVPCGFGDQHRRVLYDPPASMTAIGRERTLGYVMLNRSGMDAENHPYDYLPVLRSGGGGGANYTIKRYRGPPTLREWRLANPQRRYEAREAMADANRYLRVITYNHDGQPVCDGDGGRDQVRCRGTRHYLADLTRWSAEQAAVHGSRISFVRTSTSAYFHITAVIRIPSAATAASRELQAVAGCPLMADVSIVRQAQMPAAASEIGSSSSSSNDDDGSWINIRNQNSDITLDLNLAVANRSTAVATTTSISVPLRSSRAFLMPQGTGLANVTIARRVDGVVCFSMMANLSSVTNVTVAARAQNSTVRQMTGATDFMQGITLAAIRPAMEVLHKIRPRLVAALDMAIVAQPITAMVMSTIIRDLFATLHSDANIQFGELASILESLRSEQMLLITEASESVARTTSAVQHTTDAFRAADAMYRSADDSHAALYAELEQMLAYAANQSLSITARLQELDELSTIASAFASTQDAERHAQLKMAWLEVRHFTMGGALLDMADNTGKFFENLPSTTLDLILDGLDFIIRTTIDLAKKAIKMALDALGLPSLDIIVTIIIVVMVLIGVCCMCPSPMRKQMCGGGGDRTRHTSAI